MKKFLAVYIGSMSASAAARAAMTEDDKQRGMQAWGQWMMEHGSEIVDNGGPLGKTKQISKKGIADISNALTGYVIFEAESHQAAAQMFENHPHFSIFPGDSVEVMEIMAMPGA